MGVIMAAALLVYAVDIEFCRGKYGDATFEMASHFKRHIIGR
jgi:hypothetical protein